MALAAGSALPLQGGVNAKLGKAGASSAHAAFISFAVGTVALLSYILLTRQAVIWTGIKQLPPKYWIGGILEATYETIVILVFPKLGPGFAFSLIVAGQMAMAFFWSTTISLSLSNNRSAWGGSWGSC